MSCATVTQAHDAQGVKKIASGAEDTVTAFPAIDTLETSPDFTVKSNNSPIWTERVGNDPVWTMPIFKPNLPTTLNLYKQKNQLNKKPNR